MTFYHTVSEEGLRTALRDPSEVNRGRRCSRALRNRATRRYDQGPVEAPKYGPAVAHHAVAVDSDL